MLSYSRNGYSQLLGDFRVRQALALGHQQHGLLHRGELRDDLTQPLFPSLSLMNGLWRIRIVAPLLAGSGGRIGVPGNRILGLMHPEFIQHVERHSEHIGLRITDLLAIRGPQQPQIDLLRQILRILGIAQFSQ